MKISSNFSDYYDSMRSVDTDPDPLYVRITKEIEELDNDTRKMTPEERLTAQNAGRIAYYIPGYHETLPDWCSSGAIGFCGRVYPYISVGRDKNIWDVANKQYVPNKIPLKFAFDPQSARVIAENYKETFADINGANNFKKEKEALLYAISGKGTLVWRNTQDSFRFATWQMFIDQNRLAIGDETFRHFRAPVLAAIKGQRGHYDFFVNPRLNQFNFVQQFTPHQVWQELSMYVGNNLANLNRIEPRPITDKLKAETKGFDNWSFKNQKNRDKSERGDW